MYAQDERSEFRFEPRDDVSRGKLGWKSSGLPQLRSQHDLEIDEFRPRNAPAKHNGIRGILRTLTFNGGVPLFVPVLFLVALVIALASI
ncbi:MAG: hypothetical protein JXR14_07530 [Paracoccaceae bacterium]